MMQDKGQWKEGDRVYGLPKIKSTRIKIKKEKVEKAVDATAAGETAVAAAPGAGKAAAAKPAGKAQEKK
jgi:hypothetical protein